MFNSFKIMCFVLFPFLLFRVNLLCGWLICILCGSQTFGPRTLLLGCSPEVIYSAFLFAAIKSTFLHVINFPVSLQLFGLFFFFNLTL